MKGAQFGLAILLAAGLVQLAIDALMPSAVPAAPQSSHLSAAHAAAPQPYFDGRHAPAGAVLAHTAVVEPAPEFPGELRAGAGPIRRAVAATARFVRHPFRPRLRHCHCR